jgi:ribosomal-protein-alanine N-acetyltransferase
MGPVVISTARLDLRVWRPSDARAFFTLGQDPRVVEFITGGRPLTAEEAESFVARQVQLQASHGWCRWALALRDPGPGEPDGAVGFCGPGCTFAPDIEIGWWLDAGLWGRGLATEAASAVIGYCFRTIGFDTLIAMIAPANTRSIAVAHRVGFAHDTQIDHRGVRLARYRLANPSPPVAPDPRFDRSCEGAPSTSILGAQRHRRA